MTEQHLHLFWQSIFTAVTSLTQFFLCINIHFVANAIFFSTWLHFRFLFLPLQINISTTTTTTTTRKNIRNSLSMVVIFSIWNGKISGINNLPNCRKNAHQFTASIFLMHIRLIWWNSLQTEWENVTFSSFNDMRKSGRKRKFDKFSKNWCSISCVVLCGIVRF